MKKRILALVLLYALLLSGCASMLDRPYAVVSPHPEHPATGENPSTIKVKSYQELVNAVLYFVSQGLEHGVIKLVDYARDTEKDLTAACLEVAKDDPLGAYAVDFIKHDSTRVLTSYEANIDITYRRTPEQIRSVVNVTGSSAIRKELGAALADFQPEVALRVGHFAEDANYIGALVRQAYYDTPAAALGMPEYAVSLYPDQGSQRIVEITLTYPEDADLLQQKSEALLAAAKALLTTLRPQQYDNEERLALLPALLSEAVAYSPTPRADGTPPNTAWDAVLGDGADSEGLALAYQLFCGLLELDCTVTEGQLDGVTHFWNTLSPGTESARHVDLSRGTAEPPRTDEELFALGYQWDTATSLS